MAAAALSSTPLPASRPARPSPRSDRVGLRPLKDLAETLPVAHPLRILLAGEPDELPRQEYATKAPGWFRLLWSSSR